MICSWSNSYQSSYVVFSECFKRKECSWFFSNNLYMSKNSANCIIYNIKHKKVLSIIFTYIFYNLVRTVRLTPQFEIFIITSCHVLDKNCACWQWPTYYEIKEGRRQRHKKDRFWVNGPLWRIVFQFFFFCLIRCEKWWSICLLVLLTCILS